CSSDLDYCLIPLIMLGSGTLASGFFPPPRQRYTSFCPFARAPSAHLHEVTSRGRSVVEETLYRSPRLSTPVLALNPRESDMFVAGSTKSDSRRRAHTRARQKKFRELQRALRAESLGYSRPNKHRPTRFFNRPPGAAQTLDEHIASLAVLLGDLAHVLLTLVERNYRRYLNRLKDAVIHVALTPSKRRKRLSVADTKANAPPSHAVALREGKNLDGHLLRAFHLKYAGRNVSVKYQVG